MIKVVASLHPGGSRIDERWLATIDIHTTPDQQSHAYTVTFGRRTIRGTLPKTGSAHQNLLHVLRAVLSNPKIDRLKPGYIKRGGY